VLLKEFINKSLKKFIYDEKAVDRIVVIALAMMCMGLLALMGGGVLLGGSTEKALKSGTFTQLDVEILDSKSLKIEHMGGDPINLGENVNVYLQHNGIEYEISPDPPVTLEVANNMRLSLPDEIELKDGDSALITIKNDRKNKIIYRKELLEGYSS
jgi:hypothetical protein